MGQIAVSWGVAPELTRELLLSPKSVPEAVNTREQLAWLLWL